MKRAFSIFAFAVMCVISFTIVSKAASLGYSDKCRQIPDPGPCKGLFENYYFNNETGKCQVFFYGGCEGVVPFERLDDCQKECEKDESLSMSYRKLNNELPYAGFEVNYPKSWENQKFIVKINGKETKALWTGGGFDTNNNYASFLIAPGDAGKKNIVVVAKDQDKETGAAIDWKPSPVVELLNRTGDEEVLFEKAKIEAYVYGANNVEFIFNGAAADAAPKLAGDGMGTVFVFDPSWTEGKNTLVIKAVDNAGESIRKEYSFMLITTGYIKNGEAFKLVYGYPGSKSGPFFYLNCVGKSITCETDKEVRQFSLNDDGWLAFESKLIAEVKAVEAGKSIMILSVKEHFTGDIKKTSELSITVE